MKQNITVEQLNELTKEQSDKLCGWMIEKGYFQEFGPCPYIGQMIEFLDEKEKITINKGQGMNNDDSLVDYYTVVFCNKSMHEIKYIDNLCDALWEAVKEVL